MTPTVALERIKAVVPAVAPAGGCERLGCCIPFCRRTYKNDKKGTPWPAGAEVMCGKHYRLVPLELRQRDRQLRRVLRKIDRLLGAKERYRLGCRVVAWQHECFSRIKRAVTERAAGIA